MQPIFQNSPDTKKTEIFLKDAPNTDDPDASDDDDSDAPNTTDNNAGLEESKNPNIHWENAIDISKIPTTPKKH